MFVFYVHNMCGGALHDFIAVTWSRNWSLASFAETTSTHMTDISIHRYKYIDFKTNNYIIMQNECCATLHSPHAYNTKSRGASYTNTHTLKPLRMNEWTEFWISFTFFSVYTERRFGANELAACWRRHTHTHTHATTHATSLEIEQLNLVRAMRARIYTASLYDSTTSTCNQYRARSHAAFAPSKGFETPHVYRERSPVGYWLRDARRQLQYRSEISAARTRDAYRRVGCSGFCYWSCHYNKPTHSEWLEERACVYSCLCSLYVEFYYSMCFECIVYDEIERKMCIFCMHIF